MNPARMNLNLSQTAMNAVGRSKTDRKGCSRAIEMNRQTQRYYRWFNVHVQSLSIWPLVDLEKFAPALCCFQWVLWCSSGTYSSGMVSIWPSCQQRYEELGSCSSLVMFVPGQNILFVSSVVKKKTLKSHTKRVCIWDRLYPGYSLWLYAKSNRRARWVHQVNSIQWGVFLTFRSQQDLNPCNRSTESKANQWEVHEAIKQSRKYKDRTYSKKRKWRQNECFNQECPQSLATTFIQSCISCEETCVTSASLLMTTETIIQHEMGLIFILTAILVVAWCFGE